MRPGEINPLPGEVDGGQIKVAALGARSAGKGSLELASARRGSCRFVTSDDLRMPHMRRLRR